MSTTKLLPIQIILGRNISPIKVNDKDVVTYYKDEGGKPKCIVFHINEKNEGIKIIQLCEGVETLANDNLYNITRFSSKIQLRFNKVSNSMNGSMWCVEVFSLNDNSLKKRSQWINVKSKRKIPAKIRSNPQQISEYKKRKREANKYSDLNSLKKKIKNINNENFRLKKENSRLEQKILQLELALEFATIPFCPDFQDLNFPKN